MKECIRCKIEKSEIDFAWRDKKLQKLFAHCKECQNKISSAHYKANKEDYKARNKQNLHKCRQYVNDIKTNTPCKDCGIKYHPFVMDFDHLPGTTKRENISDLIRHAIGLKSVKNEILKCDLVCANCHRLRTALRAGNDPAAL